MLFLSDFYKDFLRNSSSIFYKNSLRDHPCNSSGILMEISPGNFPRILFGIFSLDPWISSVNCQTNLSRNSPWDSFRNFRKECIRILSSYCSRIFKRCPLGIFPEIFQSFLPEIFQGLFRNSSRNYSTCSFHKSALDSSRNSYRDLSRNCVLWELP